MYITQSVGNFHAECVPFSNPDRVCGHFRQERPLGQRLREKKVEHFKANSVCTSIYLRINEYENIQCSLSLEITGLPSPLFSSNSSSAQMGHSLEKVSTCAKFIF